jgi:hypothetical protein
LLTPSARTKAASLMPRNPKKGGVAEVVEIEGGVVSG